MTIRTNFISRLILPVFVFALIFLLPPKGSSQEQVIVPNDTALQLGLQEENPIQVEKKHEPANSRLLKIVPNPVVLEGTVKVENPEHLILTLVILDNLGNVVRETGGLVGETITVVRDDLRQGLYFLQLFQKDVRIGVGKMIIQ